MAQTTYTTIEFAWTDVADGPVTIKNQGYYPIVTIVADDEPAADATGYVLRAGETFSYGGSSNIWVRTQKADVRVSVMISEES